MMRTLRKTQKKFSSKELGGGVCNLKFSNRTPPLVILHFEDLIMKKPTGGKNIFYDHSIQNVLKYNTS